MNQAPITVNATYSAALCDQLVADGLQAAYVAPGSRSTPIALALVEHPEVRVHVFHDERAAAFAALGHGLATGTPALVLCSSGTAGAHFFAAVIEADVAAVPLIVVTADRPPELWGRGAPQTIDQTNLFGPKVRAFVEPGPPDDAGADSGREVARALWLGAVGELPGPVHLNQSFRDPLTGTPGDLPARLPGIEPRAAPAPASTEVDRIWSLLQSSRGVIVAGRGESPAADVLALATRLGWPVLADHRSGCRAPGSPVVIERYDSLLRTGTFADAHAPDVILRLGEIVSSKALSQWLTSSAATGAVVVAGRPQGRHIDPEAIASAQFDEAGVVAALHTRAEADRDGYRSDPAWLAAWRRADDAAEAALQTILAEAGDGNEVHVARAALAAVPSDGTLVVASSMPVRDVEWFGQARSDIAVVANRGANGIDGTVATAIGVAATGRPTICLLGDVALLHDSTSLVGLADRQIDLTIVVNDNDGGGIFSFLPQHQLLAPAAYERLFGTPHCTDLEALASAHRLTAERFSGQISRPRGVRIVIAPGNRAHNLELHEQIHARVAEALPD